MDAITRLSALDGFGNRIATIAATRAGITAACVGIVGVTIVLSLDEIAWMPIAASLTVGTFMMSFLLSRSKMRHLVLDFIKSNTTASDGFANMALSYLGYSTRFISNMEFIVDGEVLVYANQSADTGPVMEPLSKDDVMDAIDLASENGLSSIIIIETWFGTYRVHPDVRKLAWSRNIMMLDLNHLFGAVHAKMQADAQAKAAMIGR